MALETHNTWTPAAASPVSAAVTTLAAELRAFHGHRTVWLDDAGMLWHAEPDEMLEELGHRYVGTFLRPAADDVAEALARVRPTEARQPAPVRPSIELMPAPAFA